MPRLYLDNSATSFPKAPGVYDAIARYGLEVGASPGRGTYAESQEGARLIRQCRERLNRLIDGEDPSHIVFTLNTTDALNTAIQGFVAHRRRTRVGGRIHILTSAMDHNSVLRPLNALKPDGVEWTCIPADPATGLIDPADVARALEPDTAMVALVHASNVSGAIQPIEQIGALCRDRGVTFLVDAAQSLGHVPLSVREANIDLLAFPGHKGLLGPLGTGGLYLRPGVERFIAPYRQGGTGSESESDHHPASMPSRYECGSHNTIGIVGLSIAVQYLLDRSVAAIRAHEIALTSRMLEGLAPLQARGLRLLGSAPASRRIGAFSLRHDSLGPHELAMELERRGGILARAGLHCAPRAHAALNSLEPEPGACRISFGAFNTLADVDCALACLADICADLSSPALAASAH